MRAVGDLRQQVLPDELYQAFTDRYLELILFATEQCNFRCVYCYEDFKLGKMAVPVRSGIKNLISRRIDTLDHLRISWFGGEPLVARDVIGEIMEHAVSEAATHGDRCSVAANATTNGYFLDLPTAERLHDLNLRSYQISLDGTAEMHDRTRIKANGDGTFERIWSNLVAIGRSDLDVEILLRIHYHPGNAEDIETLIDMICAQFGGDRRFRSNLQPIQHKGGPNDGEFSVFSSAEMLDLERRLEARLLTGGNVQNYNAPQMCYAARGNSFAVRADGRIAKCTVAVRDDANTVGTLTPGGDLLIDNDKLAPWLAGVHSSDRAFALCPLSYIRAERLRTAPVAGSVAERASPRISADA